MRNETTSFVHGMFIKVPMTTGIPLGAVWSADSTAAAPAEVWSVVSATIWPATGSTSVMDSICSAETPIVWAIISGLDAEKFFITSSPAIAVTPYTRSSVRTIQRKNWVRATRATPTILPNIRSIALTEEISTSTTRLVFSSMTLDITWPPNIIMNIQIMMPRSIDTIM